MEVAPARVPSLVPFGDAAAAAACPGGSCGAAGGLRSPAPLLHAVPHPLSRQREAAAEEPAAASAARSGDVPDSATPPPVGEAQAASASSQSNGHSTTTSEKKSCPFRTLLNCRQPAGQAGSPSAGEAAAPTAVAAAAGDDPPTPPQAADCAVPSDGVYTGGPLSSAHCSRSVLQGVSWGNGGEAMSSRESSLTMSAKLRGRVVEVALNMTGGKKVLVVLFGGVIPALALTAMGTARFLSRHNSGDCPRPQAWLLVCTISCTLLTLFSCALTKFILQPHVNCASFLTSLFFHLYLVYCACMGLWIRVDPRESLYITKPESSCPLSYHDTLLVKAPIWSIIGLLGIPLLLPVFHSPLFLKRVSCPELEKAESVEQAGCEPHQRVADETAEATTASAAAAADTPATGTPVPAAEAGARCAEDVEFGVGALPQSAFFGGGATTATVQEVGAAAGVVAEMTVCFDRHLQVSLEETKTRIEQLISGLNGHGRAKRPSTSFDGTDAREVDIETVSLSLADAKEQGPYHAAEADDDFDDDSSSLQSGTL